MSSRPMFLNPFARGAEKTGQLNGEEVEAAYGWVGAEASGSGVALPESQADPRASFVGDELALALLSSKPEPTSFLDLEASIRTKPSRSQVDPAVYPDGDSFAGWQSSHAQDTFESAEDTRSSRKGSFTFRKHILAPRPFLKKMVDFLRPRELVLSSVEVRRNELRDLLSQNSGPKPLTMTPARLHSRRRHSPPGPLSRPPRPPSIDAEVLELMGRFPSPAAAAPMLDVERRVEIVTGCHSQVSIRPSVKHTSYPEADSPPRPPPKVGRVGGSMPAIPLVRQKIGVAPNPRGRPRYRQDTTTQPEMHWDVLQVNRIRIPLAAETRWLSAGMLGQGGFGTVYLVYNVARRAQCAMKVIHYARGMSEVSCRGTINELKVLSTLAAEAEPSPFLLQPFVSDELWAWRSAEQYLHIVTELCTGGDLSCYQYRLTDYNLSLICAEVILGLDYLHRLGIVHHDIKPANILVNAAGHCVISDYGGAQFLDGTGRLSRQRRNMAVMTIPFAAPELLSENDLAYPTYDQAVDYWSLGATLVSLLMDDEYLPGSYDIAMISFRLRRIEKRLSQLGISQRLQQLVLALLEESPSKRPRYSEIVAMPFLSELDWDAVKELRCPPFDYVRDIGVLAHGFSIPTARVHETRHPVDLLRRLRQEHLSLVVDNSYNVEAHKAALARAF